MTSNEQNKLKTHSVCLGEAAVFVSQGRGKQQVNLAHETKGQSNNA